MDEPQVGPLPDGTYCYRIGDHLSAARYHNAASARHDARRPQTIDVDGNLTPDRIAEGLEGQRAVRNWPPFLS